MEYLVFFYVASSAIVLKPQTCRNLGGKQFNTMPMFRLNVYGGATLHITSAAFVPRRQQM